MKSIKKASFNSFLWDFGGLTFNQGASFLVSIVLARILSPSEFGLVGIAMAFIFISQVFVDVGFSSALIQKKEVSNTEVNSVFVFNMFSGLIITLICILIAPWIGHFFDSEELTTVLQFLSLSILINSFSQVQSTLLIKSMNFKTLTICKSISSFLGGGVGIIAALNDLGVFALVLQNISSSLINTILILLLSQQALKFEFSYTKIQGLMGYSIYILFDSLVMNIFNKLDTFFIGKAFSPTILGFYTRAESLNHQISTFSSSSLNKIFFPILSKIQDDKERFDRVYFDSISLICFVSFLFSGVLLVLSKTLILGLFGDKWLVSVAFFQILVFKSFAKPLNDMMINAMKSRGLSKKVFQIGIVRKVIRTLPILVGIFYGLVEFIWAVVIISYLLTILNAYFTSKYLQMSFLLHLKKVIENAIPFFILAILFSMDKEFFSEYMTIITLAYVCVYFLYAYILKIKGLMFIKTELSQILKRIK